MIDEGQTIAATGVTVAHYLDRIGVSEQPRVDADWLRVAQRAHLRAVPFENFEVFAGQHVRVDTDYCLDQVVRRRRGGWCFVLNGAFAALLETIGFTVRRLGAAVLLRGPSAVVDHECLEVDTPQGPVLIDVGFGDRGPTVPMALNGRDLVDDGIARFAFMDSAQGLTLTRTDPNGLVPLYRFRRVTLDQTDFAAPSQQLRDDEGSSFRVARFASVLTDTSAGVAWLTLTVGERKIVGPDGVWRQSVDETEWDRLVDEHLHGAWPEDGAEASASR